MAGALSYLTLDTSEVSNSARFAAFGAAGLLPTGFELKTPPCGALNRAALAQGAPCTTVGFSDMLPEVTFGGGGTPGNYPVNNCLAPFDLTGVSDGYARSSAPLDALVNGGPDVAIPATSGPFRDGVIVAAYEVVSGSAPALGTQVSVYGRMTGANVLTQPVAPFTISADTLVAAQLVWTSATQAQLKLVGYIGSIPNVLAMATGSATTVPAGRAWLVLRMSGNVLSAEWWTQDPRMGGQAFQTITYTLLGVPIFSGQITDTQAFGSAGLYAVGLSNGTGSPLPSHIALAEWWAWPTCTATCHLYPSPFLFPAATLFPDACGPTASILAETPWTDSSRPESYDFRGFLIDNVEGLDGSISRSVDQRMGGLGGAALGPLVQTGRTLKFHGWIVATSCRGLDYGREWLISILAATCQPCPTSVVQIRVAAPSPDDGTNDQQGLYTLYDVGLTDGPTVTYVDGSDCTLSEVTFTLTAGNGYKYQASTSLLARTTFASVNGSVGVQIPTPSGLGTNGAIVTIRAGSSDLLNVYPAQQLATYPSDVTYPSDCLYPNDGGFPVTLPLTTCPSGFLIPVLPAGGTLIIDSARHSITYIDAAGNSQDGTFLLSQNTARAIDWLEADWCNPGHGDFVLVGAGTYASDASVQIDVQHREG